MAYIPPNPNGNTTAANSSPVTLASDNNGPVKVWDGTNTANVVGGDSGFNGQAVSSGTKTITFTTSATGAQTLLANTNIEGYSWMEIVYTSVGSGLALTGQFSTASGGTYVSPASWVNASASAYGALGVTVNTVYGSPVHGNFFQIAVSALTSGTFAGTVILKTFPTAAPYVSAAQSGAWIVASSTSTGTAVPSTATYIGVDNLSGNLTGVNSSNAVGDANSATGTISVGPVAYNGTNYDRMRGNVTAALVAAGATATQTAVALTTYNARYLTLLASITAGSGSIVVTINGSSSSSYTYSLLTSASLTGVGVTALRIGPDLTAAANTVANSPIPRTVNTTVTVTGTITYGVDYILSV